MPPGSHSQGQGSRQGARVQGGRGSAAHHKNLPDPFTKLLTLPYLTYPLMSCLVFSCLDLILSYPSSKKGKENKEMWASVSHSVCLSVCLALLSSLRASVSASVSTHCLPFPRKPTYVLYCTAKASFPKRTKGKNSQAPLTFSLSVCLSVCVSVCVRGKGRKEGKGASKIDWHGNSLRFVSS